MCSGYPMSYHLFNVIYYRTFQDVMKDPINREFFRRYLIYNGGEIPLNFYNNVEDLKNSKDPRAKQNKMTQITRKYFTTVPTGL